MIIDINTFVQKKKRLSITSFKLLDVIQILNSNDGHIIVNNCKIPIKNGALDLTSWNKPTKEKKAISKTKQQKQEQNKRAYANRKLKASGNIPEIIQGEYLTIHGKNKLPIREITVKNSASHQPKRLITAIRLNVAVTTEKPVIINSNIIHTNECDLVNTLTVNHLLRLKKCDTCNGFNTRCQYHVKTSYINGINLTDNQISKIVLKGI